MTDRFAGESWPTPCASCNSRRRAQTYRVEVTHCIEQALLRGITVYDANITSANAATSLRELSRRRGRMTDELKRRRIITWCISVTHAHDSGRAHFHLFLLSRLRRNALTPYLRKYGFGLREGFYLAPISSVDGARAKVGYAVRGVIDLKPRLERYYGKLPRVEPVVIPRTAREAFGVVRPPKTAEPGRYVLSWAPSIDELAEAARRCNAPDSAV